MNLKNCKSRIKGGYGEAWLNIALSLLICSECGSPLISLGMQLKPGAQWFNISNNDTPVKVLPSTENIDKHSLYRPPPPAWELFALVLVTALGQMCIVFSPLSWHTTA